MLTHGNKTPAKPRRVVVLGARGFISTRLQAACAEKGIPVGVIGSGDIDLTDPSNAAELSRALSEDDAVVMTSMLTPERGRNVTALMSNLRMAETVAVALGRTRCRHLVYVGSDAVYDANKIPLDEDSSREPIDLYALSHTAREMILTQELGSTGVSVCILRLTSVYGVGDTHNAYGPNRFVRAALDGGPIALFGRGEERRSHVYVDDVIELIGLVLDHRSVGTLNIAVRPAASFNHIARTVARLVGAQIEIQYLPRTVAPVHRPYKPTQVFRFIYNLGRPIGPIVDRTFLNSAIRAAFPGFRFTPLERGLGAFIAAEREARRSATRPAGLGTTRQVAE
jgi:nucleoside-diphosphate-sugar epimerase